MIDKSIEIIGIIESATINQSKSLNSLIIILEKLFLLDKQKKFSDQILLIEQGKNLLTDIIETRDSKSWIGLFNYVVANNFADKGVYDEAINFYTKSVQLFIESKDEKNLAIAYNSLAITCQLKGEIDQSLEYLLKALKLNQKFGFKEQILKQYNNIGTIYVYKGILDLALDFFTKVLKNTYDVNNTLLFSSSCNNIGIIYFLKGELDTALQYYQKALEIYQKSENKIDIARGFINIGEVFLFKEDITQAMDYFTKCLHIYESLNNPILLADIYFNLLKVSIHENKLKEADLYLNKMKLINSERINDNLQLKITKAEALILQESTNSKDKIKAKELFLSIISGPLIDYEIQLTALLNYCNLLLDDFKTSFDIQILEEIKKRINYINELSNENNSYIVLIESYILASKVAMIEGDFEYADQLLNQGIEKATEKGLTGLLAKLKAIHEEFLKENRKVLTQSTIKERLEQSSIIEYLKRLRRILS